MHENPWMDAAMIPCDLCNSTHSIEIGRTDRDGQPLRSVICQQCGLVFSDPRPSSEELRRYYQEEYRLDYKATLQPKAKHVHRAGLVALDRVRRLLPLVPTGARTLDFGAGGGEVVYMLKSLGYAAGGFEPNAGYARFAAEVLGVPVHHGRYEDFEVEPGSLDLVTAFHVFEHLESPLAAFRHVRSWLRPGGLFVVEVPNIEATCHWPSSRFHRAHLHGFNPGTLGMAGRRAGYRVVADWSSPDGGNIAVVLENSGDPDAVSGEMPGNYERVARAIHGHRAMSHLLSPFPYLRPLRKLRDRWLEHQAIRGGAHPREILNRLLGGQLRGSEPVLTPVGSFCPV